MRARPTPSPAHLAAPTVLLLSLAACAGGGTRPSAAADASDDRAGTVTSGAAEMTTVSTPAGVAGAAGGVTPSDGGAAGAPTGDALANDAGAAELGADAPAERAVPGCVGLLCEDFESGKIDGDKWTVEMGGGTMTVQQQVVAHGQYAMQVHGQAGPGDWALLVAKNVPAALKGTTTFGRVYFYITPKPLTSGHTQMVFAGNTGAGAANGPAPFPKLRYMEVANINGGWQLGFDLLDVGPLVEEVSYPKGQVPTMAWVCLEWEFEDHPDHITMWTDGTPIGTFDDTDIGYASPGPVPKPGGSIYDGKSSDIIGGFDTFVFGFHDWHPQKPFDLYYDDLVLSDQRVGCLK